MKEHKFKKREVALTGTLYPTPVALITTKGKGEGTNIFTAAWVSQVSMTPPHVAVAVRPSRFSYSLIEESNEFGVNLPTTEMVKEVDLCGNISGREADKWKLTGFTEEKASVISASLIRECPLSIECRVVEKVDVGTHRLFIGEVVARHEAENFLAENLLCYVSPDYRNIGKKRFGYYGFSKKI